MEGSPSQPYEKAESLGPYRLLARLATSDVSSVCLGVHEDDPRQPLAIKCWAAQVSLHQVESARRAEAQVANRFAGACPASLDAMLQTTEAGHIVRRYGRTVSLQSLCLRAQAPLAPRLAVRVFLDALAGLQALHAAGDTDTPQLVHGTPTMGHLLVGADGSCTLSNFGYARQAGSTTADSARAWPPPPPEALRTSAVVDPRADLFLLGESLWRALTGVPLFEGATTAQRAARLHARIQPPSELHAAVPHWLDVVCMTALEREPRHRYANAATMAQELADRASAADCLAGAEEVAAWVHALAGAQLEALDARLASWQATSSPVRAMAVIPLPSVQVQGSGSARAHSTPATLPGETTGVWAPQQPRVSTPGAREDDACDPDEADTWDVRLAIPPEDAPAARPQATHLGNTLPPEGFHTRSTPIWRWAGLALLVGGATGTGLYYARGDASEAAPSPRLAPAAISSADSASQPPSVPSLSPRAREEDMAIPVSETPQDAAPPTPARAQSRTDSNSATELDEEESPASSRARGDDAAERPLRSSAKEQRRAARRARQRAAQSQATSAPRPAAASVEPERVEPGVAQPESVKLQAQPAGDWRAEGKDLPDNPF